MFTPSTLIVSATIGTTCACSIVADSAGSKADPEMLTRAGRSLDAIAQRWNRMKWKFLQTDSYISVAAPFSVTGVNATAGSALITTTVASGFASVLVDDLAIGNSLVLSGTGTASTALTLGYAASSTVSNTSITFRRAIYALPANFRAVYDVRWGGRPLFYVQRRQVNRSISDQSSTASTYAYDLYQQGLLGKIRFIAPPSGATQAQLRYLRRIAMPTIASASALDIPQDYEDVFLAGAKAHFLVDKKEQGSRLAYWDRAFREGMAQMRSDEAIIADEVLTFEPAPGYGYYDSENWPELNERP